MLFGHFKGFFNLQKLTHITWIICTKKLNVLIYLLIHGLIGEASVPFQILGDESEKRFLLLLCAI